MTENFKGPSCTYQSLFSIAYNLFITVLNIKMDGQEPASVLSNIHLYRSFVTNHKSYFRLFTNIAF